MEPLRCFQLKAVISVKYAYINAAIANNTVRPEGIVKILYFTAYTEPTRSN